MVEYRRGIPREQLFLYTQCIDELVEEENIVRIIDAYIDMLDMSKLGFHMNENTTGAPAYRPQVKLKIYVYGYLNGIRSSRRLERECRRNVELIWLTEGLAPDFKTIADFRKDNRKAIKAVFQDLLSMCHRMELLSFHTAAIDGSKLRAQNSGNEIYRRDGIEQVEQEIQQKIDAYLQELEELDERERTSGVSENAEKIEKLAKRLRKQQKRHDKVAAIKTLFEEDAQLHTYFATDEESRLQSDKGKIRAGYNVQTAVEEKNKLIVVAEVTNEQNDKQQLTPMIHHIREQKEALEVGTETAVVADTGYFTEAAIMNTKDREDCRPIVAAAASDKQPSQSKSGKSKAVPSAAYENDKFLYDEQRDVFICPEAQQLTRITRTPAIDRHGRASHRYRGNPPVCRECQARTLCTRSDNGRMLRVSVNQKEMGEYRELLRTEKNQRLMAQRKEIVEHPFGTLKRSLGYTYFLLKGLEKVTAEFNLMCFTYNLKRVFNIVGFQTLMAALQ
jgi:transposase|tara:strand:- start:263 stop:1774 length:1512 start_codon:yes stop_codon:yes gene_type:complete